MKELEQIPICHCCGSKSERLRYLEKHVIRETSVICGYASAELYVKQAPLREELQRLKSQIFDK